LRPNFATARLYLAHCLEDMARWNEALQEFRRVDESRLLAELGSAQAWRVARMREHIAVCLLRLGRQQEAEKAILRFLDMAEAAASGDLEPPEQLVALVGLLPDALAARIRAVARGKPLFPAEPDRS
jgi:tetratricopeptide (TPR) repeat protein